MLSTQNPTDSSDFTTSFSGLEVCSTGFSPPEILKIKKFCLENQYSYSPCLTSNSKILIANTLDSLKIKAALDNKIKIVTIDFLKTRSSKSRMSDLTGNTVTITGFINPDQVIKRISDLNAKYSSSLLKSTDYLIAKDSLHQSKKMEMAKKWGVKVRDFEWIMGEMPFELYDSVERPNVGTATEKCEGLGIVLESCSVDFMDGVYIYLGKFIYSQTCSTVNYKNITPSIILHYNIALR